MAGMWVSIGYRTKDKDQHVLHIVGGEEAAAMPVGRALLPIYFERDDQSLSCYEAAEKISVTGNSVTLTLNRNGRVSLELPKIVEFVPGKVGTDFKKARAMFIAMQKRHGGGVIDVAGLTNRSSHGGEALTRRIKRKDTSLHFGFSDLPDLPKPVRVIDKNGRHLGVMSLSDARKMAHSESAKLVKITQTITPPVYLMFDSVKDRKLVEKRKKQR